MKIAIDAMGGDHTPGVIISGAVDAAREYGIPIILVGDQDEIESELTKLGPPNGIVDVHHCTQVADMDESPTDVLRYKKDSSIRVAFDLVKAGRADAAVSAGNSGASLAVGTIVLGRLKGVERPGIAGTFPTLKGRTVVMDIGANVDCKPSYLAQFGIMAEAYARDALHIHEPKVGLLSIGEEESKGNELVHRARDLMKNSSINFIGNVEGRDVFTGQADVVVCDGFVGNVVLKLAEGLAEAIGVMLKEELSADLLSKLGGLLAMGGFRRFKKRVDYAEFGGAPLLGLKGVGIISHGKSSPKAIKNAVKCAAEMVRTEMTDKIQAGIKNLDLQSGN